MKQLQKYDLELSLFISGLSQSAWYFNLFPLISRERVSVRIFRRSWRWHSWYLSISLIMTRLFRMRESSAIARRGSWESIGVAFVVDKPPTEKERGRDRKRDIEYGIEYRYRIQVEREEGERARFYVFIECGGGRIMRSSNERSHSFCLMSGAGRAATKRARSLARSLIHGSSHWQQPVAAVT